MLNRVTTSALGPNKCNHLVILEQLSGNFSRFFFINFNNSVKTIIYLQRFKKTPFEQDLKATNSGVISTYSVTSINNILPYNTTLRTTSTSVYKYDI